MDDEKKTGSVCLLRSWKSLIYHRFTTTILLSTDRIQIFYINIKYSCFIEVNFPK